MKNVYFLSDAHLGSRAIEHGRTQERRLVNFLDSIKHKAAAVYLLGDMFDFWYEFRLVVPKGYTRFLGKLSELTDMGVEVHFFTGNHDIWCGDYLTKECGVTIHREPVTTEIYGKEFYLAHGDGLGDPDKKFKLLHTMFHSRTLQTLFLKSHPNINFFIYGHRHIELDLMLSATARILILGDWINFFSYAVFDGENLFLENYIEGETQL